MSQKAITADDVWTRVGQTVKAYRIRRNIPQNAVASAAGITSGQLCNIEHGRCGPPLRTLIRLAAKLGVTLDDLVYGVADRRTFRSQPPPPDAGRDRKVAKRMVRAAIRFAAALKDEYNLEKEKHPSLF